MARKKAHGAERMMTGTSWRMSVSSEAGWPSG